MYDVYVVITDVMIGDIRRMRLLLYRINTTIRYSDGDARTQIDRRWGGDLD
jgi:hypothetical protein